MSDLNLITTYTFQDRQYLVKMNANSFLELFLTDKRTGEEWQCSYDAPYIENLTRKTGNFKHFEIFTTMLKSGLLKTSDCITLDLLTYEDLDSMRIRKMRNSSTRLNNNNNRRINYPLPLDYCGPPDPTILQSTIRKLESKLNEAKEKLENVCESKLVKALQKRIDDLMSENIILNEEIIRLKRLIRRPDNQVQVLQKAIIQLEHNVKSERNLHNKLVEKLQNDKTNLTNELEKVKSSEKILKSKLQTLSKSNVRTAKFDVGNNERLQTFRQRAKSPLNLKKNETLNQTSKLTSPQMRRKKQPQYCTDNNNRFYKVKQKPRSRSSSISSTKQSTTKIQYNLPVNSSSTESSRQSQRMTPYSGSGSASSLSHNSSIYIDRHQKRSGSTLKTRNRNRSNDRARKLLQNRYF